MHRINWDLRHAQPDPIQLNEPEFKPPWVGDSEGPLVAPGKYSVSLYIFDKGNLEAQGTAQDFNLVPVPNLPETDLMAVADFQKRTSDLSRLISNADMKMEEVGNNLRHIKAALLETPHASPSLYARLDDLKEKLTGLATRLSGDKLREGMNEPTSASIRERVGKVTNGHWNTRQTPTDTHKKNLEIAASAFDSLSEDLNAYLEELAQYEAALEATGAPWTPGRKLK